MQATINNRGQRRRSGSRLVGARNILGILYERVTDTDAKTYKDKEPRKVLESAEKLKKRKYSQPCADQRQQFTPFVVSVDGVLGKEAKLAIKELSQISAKSKESRKVLFPILWIRQRDIEYRHNTSNTYTICLWGSRTPTSHSAAVRVRNHLKSKSPIPTSILSLSLGYITKVL
jgi:hypothetical protein